MRQPETLVQYTAQYANRVLLAATIGAGAVLTVACGGERPAHQSEAPAAPATAEPVATATTPSAKPAPTNRPTGPDNPYGKHGLPPVGKVELNEANYCMWTPMDPQPLVSIDPYRAQMDSRCGSGMPAPSFDKPSGTMQRTPEFTGDNIIGGLPDGAVVTILCREPNGQEITDDARNTSSQWFIINAGDQSSDAPLGWIPDNMLGYVKQSAPLPECADNPALVAQVAAQ